MSNETTVTDQDILWMNRAIELSRLCPPSEGAYSVGAIVVAAGGTELARGHSRQGDPHVHAEEAALAGLSAQLPALRDATLYSTLEPCSRRASRPRPCAELVLASGLRRVVIAWREPSLFVENCVGVEMLQEAGVTVVEIPALADAARAANRHLPGTRATGDA